MDKTKKLNFKPAISTLSKGIFSLVADQFEKYKHKFKGKVYLLQNLFWGGQQELGITSVNFVCTKTILRQIKKRIAAT